MFIVGLLTERVVLSVGYQAAGSGGHCVDAQGFSSYSVYEHGWPAPFLLRIDCEGASDLDWIPFPSDQQWRLWECDQGSELSLGLLFWDMFVGLAVVFGCAAAWEWRRRRRERLFQFRLWEVFLFFALSASCLGLLVYHRAENNREHAHVRALEAIWDAEEMEKDLGSFEVDSNARVVPDWLVRLVGRERVPEYLWRYSHVLYEPGWDDPSDYFEQALPHLFELKHLDSLEIETLPLGLELPIDAIAQLPHLCELELSGHEHPRPLDIEMAKKIVRLRGLRKLILAPVDGWFLTPEARTLIQERLPDCEIDALED